MVEHAERQITFQTWAEVQDFVDPEVLADYKGLLVKTISGLHDHGMTAFDFDPCHYGESLESAYDILAGFLDEHCGGCVEMNAYEGRSYFLELNEYPGVLLSMMRMHDRFVCYASKLDEISFNEAIRKLVVPAPKVIEKAPTMADEPADLRLMSFWIALAVLYALGGVGMCNALRHTIDRHDQTDESQAEEFPYETNVIDLEN